MSEAASIRHWPLDSGASSHFTNDFTDLTDVTEQQVRVMVADGTTIHGTHVGTANIPVQDEDNMQTSYVVRHTYDVVGISLESCRRE